jgi:hypothetical protein
VNTPYWRGVFFRYVMNFNKLREYSTGVLVGRTRRLASL